jgi:hypothetical protein
MKKLTLQDYEAEEILNVLYDLGISIEEAELSGIIENQLIPTLNLLHQTRQMELNRGIDEMYCPICGSDFHEADYHYEDLNDLCQVFLKNSQFHTQNQ